MQMSMKQRAETNPYYEPIDPELLLVFVISPEDTGKGGEPLTNIFGSTASTYSAIGSEVPGEYKEYEIDVEYRPNGLALSVDSFERYLKSFEEARITQETMTDMIYDDLSVVLNTSEIYVSLEEVGGGTQIERGGIGASKHTQIGKI